MATLKCPKCGKEYKDQPDLPADKRLSGHLTGKHGLRGDEYWRAMAQAYHKLMEARDNEKEEGYG